MQTYNNLYNRVYSYKNLLKAYNEAKKGKSGLNYVVEFTKSLRENLMQLQKELKEKTYQPAKLTTFIIRDPKLRRISKSHFRDRIIHHAVVQVIEPIFEKIFINDSYANRINKGTTKAIERFDCFKRKTSKNNTRNCFVLKADIRHYFDTVDHEILMNIIQRKIKDDNVISLINKIIKNHNTKISGKACL